MKYLIVTVLFGAFLLWNVSGNNDTTTELASTMDDRNEQMTAMLEGM